MKKKSVLFVCLGNICRSPTAHAVFQKLINETESNNYIEVDSCGTGDWHIGHKPDERAISVAESNDFPMAHLRARQISKADFYKFDLILAMDKKNLIDIKKQCPIDFEGKIDLFLNYFPDSSLEEVPDPYFGSEKDFIFSLELIVKTSKYLIKSLINNKE